MARAFLSCGSKGKIPYSRSDALRAVKRLRAIGSDDPAAPLNAYRCTDCRRWHVGHNKFSPHAEKRADA
jgi:hypothetical protein